MQINIEAYARGPAVPEVGRWTETESFGVKYPRSRSFISGGLFHPSFHGEI